MSWGFGGFDIMFTIVPIFIFIVFGVIIYTIVTSAARYSKNSSSPVLTAQARVVGKRMEVTGDHAVTWYYATFEVETGERIELVMKGEEYGLLVEGDEGTITYQGEWFKGFQRIME
jgi:hypothetical protein